MTDILSGYEVMLPLKSFETKFPSLLLTFIMAFEGKYKIIIKWIFRYVYIKMFLIPNYWTT